MGQITARPLRTVDPGFLVKCPRSRFPSPCPLSRRVCRRCHRGLIRCPRRVTSARVQAVRAAVVPRLSREPASGNLNLLKRCLYIPFEKENALQHVLHTERSRPTRRAQTELQTKEMSALFMTDFCFYSQGSEVNYYKNADRTCNICHRIIHPAVREPQISM